MGGVPHPRDQRPPLSPHPPPFALSPVEGVVRTDDTPARDQRPPLPPHPPLVVPAPLLVIPAEAGTQSSPPPTTPATPAPPPRHTGAGRYPGGRGRGVPLPPFVGEGWDGGTPPPCHRILARNPTPSLPSTMNTTRKEVTHARQRKAPPERPRPPHPHRRADPLQPMTNRHRTGLLRRNSDSFLIFLISNPRPATSHTRRGDSRFARLAQAGGGSLPLRRQGSGDCTSIARSSR